MRKSKRENQLSELRAISFDSKALANYLLSNSNLPGKRGNIELGFSFADYVEENYNRGNLSIFNYCLSLIDENNEQKNVIGNEEFLPFCAIVALGRIGKIDHTKKDEVINLLKKYATDGRWRIREAVAMAIQEIMDVNPKKTMERLIRWLDAKDYLVQRALVAGLAEPRLLKNYKIAKISLEIHKEIIKKVTKEKDIKDPNYQVLIKGLCYTLSVVVAGIEDEGFKYLEELARINNPVIKKIVRENLKKHRLRRLDNSKVINLQKIIQKTL